VIFDGEKERRGIDEAFDHVIVGSGAAGATAARVLADTGDSVAVVEEGPAVDTREFEDRTLPTLRRMYRDMGTQVARGRTLIPVLQGRCLGGSTVVNSAIIWRLPEDVWQPWKEEHGLGGALPLEELHENWNQIERELSIAPTPEEAWGENNRLMGEAGRALGIHAAPITRAVHRCRGSARCQSGCPYGAKQSMLVTYLPYAEQRGAALFTSGRVDRVVLAGERASAVEGHFHVAESSKPVARFRLGARKAVVVAASATQTPGLLARSGVRSRHLGAHFQANPGASVVGVFDQEVRMWSGATQGYESDHHRRDGRFKIETIALSPEVLFPRLPGVGRAWLDEIARSGHMASWAVELRTHAEGSIREGRSGAVIRFDLDPRDVSNLKRGLGFTAEMLFAAGAREVLPGIHDLPQRLTKADEVALIESGPDDPRAYSLVMTHLFGTTRMSVRPQDGVVGTDFAVHGTRNLYVLDSSIFPTNTGVNPQHTIMGIAMHGAKKIREGVA
jgi:choline dehydrogenase-like flavoprotein